jgi:hypothetical protein
MPHRGIGRVKDKYHFDNLGQNFKIFIHECAFFFSILWTINSRLCCSGCTLAKLFHQYCKNKKQIWDAFKVALFGECDSQGDQMIWKKSPNFLKSSQISYQRK